MTGISITQNTVCVFLEFCSCSYFACLAFFNALIALYSFPSPPPFFPIRLSSMLTSNISLCQSVSLYVPYWKDRQSDFLAFLFFFLFFSLLSVPDRVPAQPQPQPQSVSILSTTQKSRRTRRRRKKGAGASN